MVEREPERLLAAYRSGLGPPRAVEERMLASLQAQMAALPQPSVASGGAGATATVKLAAVVLAVSVGVAAVVVAIGRDAPPVERAPVVQMEPAPVASEVEPPLPASPPAVPETPATVEAEIKKPSEAPQPRTTGSRRRVPTEEPKPAPSLADEAKLLRSVDVALRQGDLETARTQLDAYRDSFSAGSLRAQAEELALLLACADGPAGAKERARDHLAAHPDSRARNRIEEACGIR